MVLPGLLAPDVGAELSVDAVGDLTLQRPSCFAWCFAFGDLAVVVGAALAVRESDLCDRNHVQRMVQRPVPSTRQQFTVRPEEENSTGAVPLYAA